MSLLIQNPLSNSTYRVRFYFPKITTQFNPTKTPNLSFIQSTSNPHKPQFQIYYNNSYSCQRNVYLLRNRHNWHIKSYYSSINAIEEHERSTKEKSFNFDDFLSVLESLCVVSSLVISVGCIVNWVLLGQQNSRLVSIGNRILAWLLAGAVAVGSVIRRRQWGRVCGSPPPEKSKPGSENGNLIERVEKLEDSLRSTTTIIRMLSRHLEKLGIRFRVTRKALKEPISEAAALAQKNSEATRALAVQEDILEKELAEVQKVLLAMQDQQRKQLELILAIAESGKLLDTKPKVPPNQSPSPGPRGPQTRSGDNGSRQVDDQQIQAMATQGGSTSEQP